LEVDAIGLHVGVTWSEGDVFDVALGDDAESVQTLLPTLTLGVGGTAGRFGAGVVNAWVSWWTVGVIVAMLDVLTETSLTVLSLFALGI